MDEALTLKQQLVVSRQALIQLCLGQKRLRKSWRVKRCLEKKAACPFGADGWLTD
jgi:hypothetical protein